MTYRVCFSILMLILLISASNQNGFFTDSGSGSGFGSESSDCDPASTSLLPSSAGPTSNSTLPAVHSLTSSASQVVTVPISSDLSAHLPTSIDTKLATSTRSAVVESLSPTSTHMISTTMSLPMVTSIEVSSRKPSSFLPSASIPPPSSETILPSSLIPSSSSESIPPSFSSSLQTTDSSTESLLTTSPLTSVQSSSSSSLSISPPHTSDQPSSSVPRSTSTSFLGSSAKVASTTSFQTSVSPSLTPSVSNMTLGPQSIIVPIAASVGSVLAIFIICLLLIVCIVCIRKRKRRLGYLLTTAGGVDGTTLANEYKLYEFTKSKKTESNVIFGQQEEASTLTFGKKSQTLDSPVEIDLGTGSKITFPDTPIANSGESLPALIIYNPVRSDELTSNTLPRGSKTLPTRGNQKCSADGTDLEAAIDHAVGTHVKSSKSTSEINKTVSAPGALPPSDVGSSDKVRSPIYDTPRVLKTPANERTDASGRDVVSGEYVTMESHSQVMSSNQLKPADRLAPKRPSVSSEPFVSLVTPNTGTEESLYDNARLIQSKKITNTEKAMLVTSPEPQASASTIYDVPRSVLTTTTIKDKTEGDSMPVKEKVKEQALPTVPVNFSEGVYDIPKQPVLTVEKVGDPSAVSKPEGIYDHPRNASQPTVLTGVSHTSKETQSNQVDKAATASDYKDAKAGTGPSKPSLLPKPNIASRKPAPSENILFQSTNTQVTSAGSDTEDGHNYEMPPPRDVDEIPKLEVKAQQPEVVTLQLEQVKPKPSPKPRAKQRKLAQRPLMPQNVMQELYSKQSMKSKDSERTTDTIEGELSPKHTKPPVVKPKPKLR